MSNTISKSLIKPALLALVIAAGAPAAMAQTTTPAAMASAPTTLTLSATGTENAAPDMATISFAVVTQGATASAAMQANNTRMNAVLAALKKAGIDKADIQTSNLNLNPQYDYKDGQAPKLNGYQAQNQISVRVNDTARTGPVVDAVIAAGIDQISSIDFGLKDDSAIRDAARKAAVATLMQRAKLYAEATGMHVKRLASLQEGETSSVQPPRPMMMTAVRMKDEATPVNEGQLEITVPVSATFELE